MEILALRHPKVDLAASLPSSKHDLLNHGDGNHHGICYGQSDVELIGNWKEEVDGVLSNLKGKQFEGFFSSPLTRCIKVAKYIYGKLHDEEDITTPKADARLMELNFGRWEMMAWSEIPHDETKLWMDDFVNTRCPGGESYFDLLKRVSRFLKELARNYLVPLSSDNSSVLLLTHSGVIWSLYHLINGIDRKDVFSIQLEYSQIYRFTFDISKTRLI